MGGVLAVGSSLLVLENGHEVHHTQDSHGISAKITESILICVKRFFLPFSLACAFAEFSGDLRPVAHGGTQA
jgi:hypothetical protein